MKILPINLNPIAIAYNSTGFPLSIMFGENEDLLPYFLNTHIQVYADKNVPDYNFYNYYIPYHEWECFDYQVLRKYYFSNDILNLQKFIETSIENSYYVITYWDEFYIKERKAFDMRNFIHDVLIYGYDTTSYYILGYDKNGKYTTSLIDKEIFFRSVMDDSRINDCDFYDVSQFIFLLKNRKDFTEKLSIKTINRLIHEYVSSYSDLVRFVSSESRIFGLEAFILLSKEICNSNYLDIRSLRLFNEHKKIMQFRFEYMFKHGLCNKSICDKYQEIKIESDRIFLLYLKYTIVKKRELVLNISDKIINLLNKEKEILLEYLNNA